MEYLKTLSIEDAIEKLERLRKNGVNNVTICIIDFDQQTERKKKKSIDEGCSIIKEAESIIYNSDKYVPHIMAFKGGSLSNLSGVMHDIFLHVKKLE